MSSKLGMPWQWTPARWERHLDEHSDARGHPLPFRLVCLLCGLPSVTCRPTRRHRWMALCGACAARSFLKPPCLWAITGLSADLWSAESASVGPMVQARRVQGLSIEEELGWEERMVRVRRRRTEPSGPTWRQAPVRHLRGVHGCPWCGEPFALTVRENQLGQPQLSCPTCQTIVHSVRPELVSSYLGWSKWMQEDAARAESGASAWIRYRRAGRGIWRGWSDPLAGAAGEVQEGGDQGQQRRGVR